MGKLIYDTIYFKLYLIRKLYIYIICNFSGLDVKCIETIDSDIKQRVLNEIKNIKTNDRTLCSGLKPINIKCKPLLYARHITCLRSWTFLGKWLLQIYENIFENYEHSVIVIF